MISINYYDLSGTSDLTENNLNGKTIDINDLLRHNIRKNESPFLSSLLVREINEDFDPYGIKKPKKWEALVATVIYCLTGIIPSSEDVRSGRQIIFGLPAWFKKKYLTHQFVVAFLPYILIGFRSHSGKAFHEDSNTLESIIQFIIWIYDRKEIEIISFLCAQRGISQPGIHLLIDRIQENKTKKTLNLQMGILSNTMSVKKKKIIWYQQASTERAASNMFPVMFIQYLEKGQISDLLLLLDNHFQELSNVVNLNLSDCDRRIINLDSFTNELNSFLEKSFGSNWKCLNFKDVRSNGDLLEIALNYALPEVKRFMPFYETSREEQGRMHKEYFEINIKRAQINAREKQYPDLINKTKEAIAWFYQNQIMDITAKAVYEASFYYLWGKMIGSNENACAVGIDRDHAIYQFLAWRLGYLTTRKGKGLLSLIYTRRIEPEENNKGLKGISFRQFWR